MASSTEWSAAVLMIGRNVSAEMLVALVAEMFVSTGRELRSLYASVTEVSP